MLSIKKQNKYYNPQTLKTPYLVMDKSIIADKYKQLENITAGVQVFYAVKANPDINIIGHLHKLGCGFEISSQQELKEVLSIRVNPEMIISSNPLKLPEFIKAAYQAGVKHFSYDSQMEIDKLSKWAPGSKGYLRLEVDNSKSEWPLSKKFGVAFNEALKLLEYATKSNMNPEGITFHVGSQCTDSHSWKNAIDKTNDLFKAAKTKKINLHTVNIGGGIPIHYTNDVPSVEDIGRTVSQNLKEKFTHNAIKVMIEPGRALVGDCGNIVTKVILKAVRKKEHWLYLDVGVFNGLMETLEGMKYDIFSERHLSGNMKDVKKIPYTIAGPSCDSLDVMFKNYLLPADLRLGDILYIINTGAYTTAYASKFNGIPIPKTYFIEK